MSITPWKKIGEPVTLASGYGKSLVRQSLRDHHGVQQDFFFIDGAPWSIVFAITKRGEVVLVRQFEQGSNSVLEGLPGGGMKNGELPEAAVCRELKEETGYRVGRIIPLGTFWLDPRSSRTYCHVFFADKCELTSDQSLDRDEQIEVSLVPLGEYVGRIMKSRTSNQVEAIALMRAFPYFSFGNKCKVAWAFAKSVFA